MGILFALIAMLSWGAGDFLIQRSTRKFGDWMTLFYLCAFGSIVLFPFAIKEIPALLNSNRDFFILVLAGTVELAAALFMFESLKKGKLSVEEPIFTFEVLVTAALAGFIIKELPNVRELLLIISLVAGIMLVSLKSLHHLWQTKLEKGAIFAMFGAIGMGATNFLYGFGARVTSPIMINWFTDFMLVIVCLIYININLGLREVAQDFKKYKTLILSVSLFDNAAWLAFSYSMTLIPIAIATGLSESYIALAALLGLVINREKLKLHQFVGLAITIIAAAILAYLR